MLDGPAGPRGRVPDGVVEAYEAVVDKVDLAGIAARERVTRHDVKARIEEFCALAGHEHIHKGMTSRDLTENVEQLQIRAALGLVRRADAGDAWRGWRGSPRSTRLLVMTGRSHNVAAQATTLGKRFATSPTRCWWRSRGSTTCSPATRCAASRARWAPPRTCSTCSTATSAKLADLELRVAAAPRLRPGPDQRRPGLPALASTSTSSRRWSSWSPARPTSPPRSG